MRLPLTMLLSDRRGRHRLSLMPACLLFMFAMPCGVFAKDIPTPRWIWVNAKTPRARTAQFRKAVVVPQGITAAEITGVADFCSCRIFINGRRIAEVEDYSPKFRFDMFRYVKPGRNLITLEASSHSGPPAIALRLRWKHRDGTETDVVSNETWQAKGPASDWKAAVELGVLASEPWGDHPDSITINALDDYTQWKQAIDTRKGADPARFFSLPGFQIELLRSAGPKEGSWVSLAFDTRGRLVVAREDKGLLRFTLSGQNRRVTRVETVNDSLKECRGLLFAHGALYANANNSKGLYRLRDTNGDGRFDEVRLLRQMPGGVGHGRNDLALGPDGMIYAIHDDSVAQPADMPNRRSPLLSQSRAGNHGFVMRMDRDGRNWEVVTTGMRNPFGIAFDRDGEMFTYDADAEYDMGASWYRPTRILHLLPGGDFGWRAVTRAWPAYNPDTAEAAPPALSIGKGSPTAVKFGTRSRFPGKYRRALFALDWAYGRILAVHKTPRGGGYAMRAETFVKGRPFNVTDLGFGPDGAMYVVTGGRKTQSGLYRIRYVGNTVAEPKQTTQQLARERFSTQTRELRRRLETLQKPIGVSAVEFAWPHLNSPDPFLRHAARVVIEHQPLPLWRQRAFSEKRPLAAVTAMLALAQHRRAIDRPKIVEWLEKQPLKKLPSGRQRVVLRICDLILSETPASDQSARKCLRQLDAIYPSKDFEVNSQLSRLLVRLNAPHVVERTMKLLEQTTRQKEQFAYIYVLRIATQGWSPELRERYFRHIPKMREYIGGDGMSTFIARITADATSKLTAEQRQRMKALLVRRITPIDIPASARNRKFVKDWTTQDLTDVVRNTRGGRNFARGKALFEAAACSACHRVNRHGNAIGPDLTSVGRRFSRHDILQSILDPSKVVAEKYRRDVVVTKNGKLFAGTILEGGDYRAPKLRMLLDPLHPDQIITIAKADIEQHRRSKTSKMPKGLLNTLTKSEILDLLAYLESGGNARHPAFRK